MKRKSPRFNCPCLAMALLLVFSQMSVRAQNSPVYDSEQSPEKPISGAESVRKITLPEGFSARLLAQEPTVRNPIALQYDDRGRLWIAENFTYAERGLRIDPNLRDRLIILQDLDHNAAADAASIFSDQLHNLTGFAIGRGGIWAICPPQLLFIPDANQDDKPDSPPQVILDGFTVAPENHHNFANGLKFGPDGWLYGRCGGSFPGEIGKPGTPENQRISLRGGIWRYHPQTKAVEVLTHGTTNPWGMDWDKHGEAFFTNTVNGHLWHLVPGSHLDRLHTIDPNPNAFQLMQQTADHFHYDTGQGWVASRDGAANSLGGGHAHQGALIYQGGAWPEIYHGRLFTINFHGRRINSDTPQRRGSGYVAGHDRDFAIFGDTWFRGLDMAHAPNGNIMVIDWSDTGECHENTGVHRSSGRIYELGLKSSYSTAFKPFQSASILDDLKSNNIFYVRRALAKIANSPDQFHSLKSPLTKILLSKTDEVHRLRSLWALKSIDALSEMQLMDLCLDQNEHLRTWAIRFLMDSFPLDTIMGERRTRSISQPSSQAIQKMLEMAGKDPSGLVRLVLASSIQRLDFNESRIALSKALASRPEDRSDSNLNLMVWYGIAPFAELKPEILTNIASGSQWPLLNQMIARKMASAAEGKTPSAALDQFMQSALNKPDAVRNAILIGFREGLSGRDQVPEPRSWKAFSSQFPISETQDLAALFGDGIALDSIRKLALDNKMDMKTRRSALKTLVERNPPDLNQICMTLLGIRYLNTDAIAGLTRSPDPAIGQRIVATYQNFSVPERSRVIDVLVQRQSWAKILLEAIGVDKIPKQDLSVAQARQIMAFGNSELSDLLMKNWGRIGLPSETKARFVAQVKSEGAGLNASPADFKTGRELYQKSCGQCHSLYGEGGRIGPDITGAQRQNLDYLLDNIVEPSAVVSPDFRLTNLQMKDGRVLSGLVRPRDKQSLTLITTNQTFILLKNEIEDQKVTEQSIMPEGQLEAMNAKDRQELLRYLMTISPPLIGKSAGDD
ncbi:MAG: hypothetical protein DWH73_00265 [Planctomycetota bacterium]|nr:MAG: hypothetical protein DWH73_00265 [Planctomycetota bacterium]